MTAAERPTAVLFCPGRGSYGKEELGCIRRAPLPDAIARALADADDVRRAAGQPALADLDAAPTFRPSVHLDGRNASELIYFATLAASARAFERYRVVGVAGNSLGWYSALAVAGCLSPFDGWTLVSTMARLQEAASGGQVMTTTVGDDWLPDPARTVAVDEVLDAVNRAGPDTFVAPSIRLGGHSVLAGTEAGVAELLRRLPKVQVGDRTFPFRLAGHGPFHTPLCAEVAARARAGLAGLPCGAPQVHLIDGFGRLHTPWSADPAELLAYTLGAQVVETFDFTAAVRVALRELNPDVLVCLGPGTSLRAPVGHVVLREGYRGLRARQALFDSGLVAAA
ncbi:MAG TPA: ACP S-malonyltransferase [Planctomycetota bacterium]|nr:ACP S-malonyltransferase [Planctomycetota bacterium]